MNNPSGKETTLYDASGNPVSVTLDAAGGAHMGSSIIQTILLSSNNYTDSNLATYSTPGDPEFVGVADETSSINGIQVFATADRDITVTIEQSTDPTFADSTTILKKVFLCYANMPQARTFASSAPYYRLRVQNTDPLGTTTTKLEVATGMTPIISTLPDALSTNGNLQVVSSLRGDENTERHSWVNPTNELNISPVYRLVGTTFSGDIIDPNFWTSSELRDATVEQSGGAIMINTGTTALGYGKLTSVRKGRFVAGSAMIFSGLFAFKTAGTANNVRRCGAYTTSAVVEAGTNVVDGYFFQLYGTVFGVGYRNEMGTITVVTSGSFNGNIGVSYTPPSGGAAVKLSIEYTPAGVFWYIGNKLLHKMNASKKSSTDTLPITMENENYGGALADDIEFETSGVYIGRQGELNTNKTYKWIGADGTHILKYGAGVLDQVIVSDNKGLVTIYDGVTATVGTEICILDTAQGSNPLGSVHFGAPFNEGLTIVTTGNIFITVVYE